MRCEVCNRRRAELGIEVEGRVHYICSNCWKRLLKLIEKRLKKRDKISLEEFVRTTRSKFRRLRKEPSK